MHTMRFRAGLIVGAAAGYVLGARAGRERYEQIKRVSARTAQHPAVAQILDQAGGVTDLFRSGVAGGLSAGARDMRKAAEASSDR